MKLDHTVTVSGTIQKTFGGEPWGDPKKPYGFGPAMFVDPKYGDRVEIGVTGPQGGWARILLTREQVQDLIVTLENATHPSPLVEHWID